MRELFINSKLVDIDSDTRITLQYKSFLFSGISEITSPHTWTVSLPITARNKKVIEQAQSPDYSGDYPYSQYTVDYYSKSLRLINGGKATLTSITDRINFVFTFGKIFELIKELETKKLTELTEGGSDYLEWNRSMNLSRPGFEYMDETAFGFKNWYNYTNEDRTFTSHADMPFAVTHPAIPLSWIIDKIESEFSITITDLGLTDICIPITKTDGISTISVCDMNLATSITRENTVDKKIKFTAISGVYFKLGSTGVNILPNGIVNSKYAITADVQVFAATGNTINLVVEDAEGNATIIEELSEAAGEYTAIGVEFDFTKTDSKIYLECYHSTIITYATLTMTISPLTAQYSSDTTGGFFPIIPNLPDMTCSEFITDCMIYTGKFPFINDIDSSEILFRGAQTLISNVGTGSLDWSGKLIDITEINYRFGDYAQKNSIDYNEGEAGEVNGTVGYLNVQNSFLEPIKELARMKFNAAKPIVGHIRLKPIIDLPLYDISVQSGVLITNKKDIDKSYLGKIAARDVYFTEAMKFSSIVQNTEYTALQSLILKPRVIKANVMLNAVDIFNLNMEKPIYFKQTGKYYAILTAQVEEEAATELELLEIQ
jgi:hypothetical protein